MQVPGQPHGLVKIDTTETQWAGGEYRDPVEWGAGTDAGQEQARILHELFGRSPPRCHFAVFARLVLGIPSSSDRQPQQ